MNIYAWSGVLGVVTGLTLPIIVFIHSDKASKSANALWVAMNAAVAFYCFGIILSTTTQDYQTALFYWRISYLGIPLIAPFYFHHVCKTIGVQISRKLLAVVYGVGIFYWLLNIVAPQLFIYELRWTFNSMWYPDFLLKNNIFAGIPAILFLTYFFSLPLAAMYKIFVAARNAAGDYRKQLYIFLVAGVVGFGGAGIFSYLPPFHIDISLAPNFGIPIYHIVIAYAIIRYGFYNTKVVAAELLTVFLGILFVVSFFAAKNFVLQFSLLVGFGAIAVFLIRSSLAEMRLADKLKDLNEHLQQKVDEQTAEIKKAYEVEKKARFELEELDKAKDQFILTTQHHLRTPLTIIKGYVQTLIEKHPKEFTPQCGEILGKVNNSTDRLAGLVNELLDITEMRVGQSILKVDKVNIKEVIEEVLSELRQEIDGKHLSLSTSVADEVILKVDKVKFKEALTNLIDNAVKYNKESGEIRVKGEKINHPIERDKEIYRLTIEDTGIGIAPEDIPKLFTQYFYRSKEAEKAYATGRGIGLAVTKNIISAHNGRIYAESDGRNKGAKFVVELPAN